MIFYSVKMSINLEFVLNQFNTNIFIKKIKHKI